jgi:hypothetical protein
MSTRNLPGGKRLPTHKADKLSVIYEPIIQKMRDPGRLTTVEASTECQRRF